MNFQKKQYGFYPIHQSSYAKKDKNCTVTNFKYHVNASGAKQSEVFPIVTCNSCDNEAAEHDLFCRQCGEEVEHESDVVQCDCSAIVGEKDKYCHACGAEFSETVEKDDNEGDDDDSDDTEGNDDGDDEDDDDDTEEETEEEH